jgi:hypothetical protein
MRPDRGAAVHYLIQQQDVMHEQRTIVDCITLRGPDLVPDERHAGGVLFAPLGLLRDERALLLAIRKLYCTNDTGQVVEFVVDLCFEPLFEAAAVENGSKAAAVEHGPKAALHPDRTGRVATRVYPSAPMENRTLNSGVVPPMQQCVYQANLSNMRYDITQYAGLEDSIRNARSGAAVPPAIAPPAGAFEIFTQNDPFLVFMMQNRSRFATIADEDIRPLAGMPEHYRVKKHAVQTVRRFFEDAIFPLFHYTQSNSLRVTWTKVKQVDVCSFEATLTVMFELVYIVIVQRDPKVQTTTTRLKL